MIAANSWTVLIFGDSDTSRSKNRWVSSDAPFRPGANPSRIFSRVSVSRSQTSSRSRCHSVACLRSRSVRTPQAPSCSSAEVLESEWIATTLTLLRIREAMRGMSAGCTYFVDTRTLRRLTAEDVWTASLTQPLCSAVKRPSPKRSRRVRISGSTTVIKVGRTSLERVVMGRSRVERANAAPRLSRLDAAFCICPARYLRAFGKSLGNQFLLVAYVQRQRSRCRGFSIAEVIASLARENSSGIGRPVDIPSLIAPPARVYGVSPDDLLT